jgi:hypothetical protein
MSTRLLVDLLRSLGHETVTLLQARNPDEIGNVVSWAGPDPAPVWLDTAGSTRNDGTINSTSATRWVGPGSLRGGISIQCWRPS